MDPQKPVWTDVNKVWTTEGFDCPHEGPQSGGLGMTGDRVWITPGSGERLFYMNVDSLWTTDGGD